MAAPSGARSRGARLLVGRVGGVAGSLATGQIVSGLTYVLAARQMDPAGLGVVATCIAIGAIAAIVFDFGLTSLLVREVASDRIGLARARALLAVKRRFVPILMAATLVPCLLLSPVPAEGVVLGAAGWLAWEAQTANALLRACERFATAAAAQVVSRLVGLGVTVVLLALVRPELALAAGIVAGFAGEAMIALVALGRHSAGGVGIRDLVRENRRSASFGLVSLSASGQQLDTPLVTLGGGAAAGGIYAGAGRLIGPMLFLSAAMALVGAPWLGRAHHDPELLAREERRIGVLALVLAAAPLAAAAVGPSLIPLLLGAQFRESGSVFAVLAVGAALSTLNQGAATVLQNRGNEAVVGSAITVGLLTGLVATLALAYVAGPVWSAAGFVASQLYILARLGVSLRNARRTASGSQV